jgi:hypothetical protein
MATNTFNFDFLVMPGKEERRNAGKKVSECPQPRSGNIRGYDL